MGEFFVLLNFWCAAFEQGSYCNSAVTQIWYPTMETCEERSEHNKATLTQFVTSQNAEIYHLISKCIPIEQKTIDPVN